nr:piggyBac transposable element-derived protein 2-like [Dermacentor andersoni]
MMTSSEEPVTADHSVSSSDEDEKENNQQSQPKRKKTAVKWIRKDFSPQNTACTFIPRRGSTPSEPLEYFSKYYTDEIFVELAHYTNMYALHRDGAELYTTPEEIKVFFGVMMRMALLKFPRVRMYWQEDTRIPTIAEAMTCKRFFKLRAALHVTDSNAPKESTTNKFWKVAPILNAVRSRCLDLDPLEQASIDEQMVPFTGRVPGKQFVKNKPNPEGIKVLVRCSSDGMAQDFEFYQGKGTGVSKDHSYLGLGGSVVMRLVQHLPRGQNIRCFMDNYFSSVPLYRELKLLGILASGSIRSNRLLGCELKSDKELKKEGRGSHDFKITEEEDVVIVRWHDNGPVNMISTLVGVGNPTKVKRWSDSAKEHVDLACPQVIAEYNKFMGGVNKLDFLMSLYPLYTRTKKWPVRVISHFISFAVCNSWIEYIRDANEDALPRKEVKDVMAFQSDIARSLIASNKSAPQRRGRPSTSNRKPARQSHSGTPMPTNSTRFDGTNHWPMHTTANFPQRCRNSGCASKSRICCRKYGVFLCLSAAKDCYYEFHNKK